jgi:hypothetical protein
VIENDLEISLSDKQQILGQVFLSVEPNGAHLDLSLGLFT